MTPLPLVLIYFKTVPPHLSTEDTNNTEDINTYIDRSTDIKAYARLQTSENPDEERGGTGIY
jgi:hypothetical protein